MVVQSLIGSRFSAINQRAGMTLERHPALTKTTVEESNMAATGICSVDGCDKPISKRQMCNAHYLRWYRHGDVHRKARADNGEPSKWLREHVAHEGSDCLIWPFAKGRDGRGRLQGDVSPQAHRAMCILAHGAPPTPKHEAAHSCGKGRQGCVHPAHLRWATPVENAADRVEHCTETRGEDVWSSKLTQEDVRRIRSLKGHYNQKEIGAMFGVDAETVGNIHRRETWAWLE